MSEQNLDLPAHIEDTLQATAKLRNEHYQHAPLLQRLVNRTRSLVGQPVVLIILTTAILAWVGGNIAVTWSGRHPWDPPPFNYLTAFASLAALYMTLFVLAAQQHDDELSTHREQMTLNLAILADQKTTKIINLLEELRRDSPNVENRVDHQAQAFAAPADLRSVLEAVKET